MLYEKYKLPNGLEVILLEDHRLPLIGVDLWYHVGPLNERPGRTGFAHLFEHMMFEGSKHVGEKSHFKFLEAAGARPGPGINGTTDFDRTNYFETVPSDELELALWLESDRMGFLLDTLDATKLANQRDVVRNERRQGLENQPYGLVDEAVIHQLFPRGHPYYGAVIGSHADIEAARLNDVRDFFGQYYVPNNCTLAIAGDIDKRKVNELIAKYFGPLPSGKPVPKVEVKTPAITSERRQIVTDAVQLPRLYIAWLVPPAFAPGDAEAEFATRILGGGKSSRLYRKLVYEEQIAQDASCTHQSLALGSPLECTITARPGIKPEQLEAEANREIEALIASGPTNAELERARNTKESEMIRGLETLGGFGGVADTLNYYNQYLGDPGYLHQDLARYENATTASVQQLAKSNLTANQRVVVYGVPGPKAVDDVPRSAADVDAHVKIQPEYPPTFEQQQAWRATPPEPGPAPKINLPEPSLARLNNGLKIQVVENHSLPILAVRFLTLAGGEAQDPRQAGIAGFTAAMLTEGTTHRTAPQVADDTDQIGAKLDKDVTADYLFVSLSVLSNVTKPALDLLSDVTTHPLFATNEVERIRTERLTSLLQLKDQPTDLANFVGYRALYGPGDPYGYTDLGTGQTLRSLTRDDLSRFWSNHYSPVTSALVFAGDITVAQARSLAEQYFGQWQDSATASTPPPAGAPPSRKIVLVDQPSAPQSTISAMGTGLRRATSIMALIFVCGTGSSSQAGRNRWIASANSTAVATLKRQWASISRSTASPTASRTARMMSTARSTS